MRAHVDDNEHTGSDLCHVGPEAEPDRYALGSPMGAGAEGILYRGTITVDSGAVLDVAVKMLHPDHRARMAEWHRRWSEQVELLRSLQAPGVVAVRDGFIGPLPHPPGTAEPGAPTTLYLVMNWVEGEPLDAWAATHDDASPADVLKMLLPVAGALDLMHSGQATGGTAVIHGDVKPANILVQPGGDAVLVDFGLVRSLPGGRRLTGVAGTPGYMAPEVARDGSYTPAADRYALGGVAYFLLTGEELPADHDDDALRERLTAAQPGRGELVHHVMAMLALDPAARPRVLANWCAQLRNSSLDPALQPETLAPMVGARIRGLDHSAGSSANVRTQTRRRRRSPLVVVPLAICALAALLAPHLNTGGKTDIISGPVRPPSTSSSTLAASTSTQPMSPSAPTSGAGPQVQGAVFCKNPLVGYHVQIPAGFVPAKTSKFLGDCEAFSPAPLPRPLPAEGGLSGEAIVFAALPSPSAALLRLVSDRVVSQHSTTIGGRSTIVVEHRVVTFGPEEAAYKGARAYTYLIDVGRFVLAAQLLTPAKQLSEHADRRTILDEMVKTIGLTTERCRNQVDPRCGPFYFDPDPVPNQPLEARVTFSPSDPQVGDTVTFSITVSDPDAEIIDQVSATYEDEPMVAGETLPRTDLSIIDLVRSRRPTAGIPAGRWVPPRVRRGEWTTTLFHVYQSVGDFHATFGYRSSSTGAPLGHDPYGSTTSETVVVPVR